MNPKAVIRSFLFCIFFLFALQIPLVSGGQVDETTFLPAVNYLLRPTNVIELNPEEIGGPGSEILYQGIMYDAPVVVPENAIVGVKVNGQMRLYHSAMGNNVTFSDTTDKLAFACFWLSLQAGDLNNIDKKKSDAFKDLTFAKSVTSGNSLPNGTSVGLPPAVSISRNDPSITFTNTYQRWVAVKVYAATTPQVYFLAPAGRAISSNVILTLGNQGLISSDYFNDTKSPNSVTISTSDVTRIDVFGAVFRAYSVINERGSWPPGTAESWEGYRSDRELVLKLNLLDTMHFMLEGIEHLLGVVPIECFDAGVSALTNQIEFLFLSYTTEEERVSAPYLYAFRNELVTSLTLCLGELAVAPLALLNTFTDMVGLLDFIAEDVIFAIPQMAYSHSFWVIDDVPQPSGTCKVPPQTISQKGHTWQRCAPYDIPDVRFGSLIFTSDNGFIYIEAEQYCQNLTLAGHSDWRLPTKGELKDLVYCSNDKPTPLDDNSSCRIVDNSSGTIELYDIPTWYPGAGPRWTESPPNEPIYIPNYTDFSGPMDWYWTDTNYSDTEMWTVDFYEGVASPRTKNYTEKRGLGTYYEHGSPAYVRCVR